MATYKRTRIADGSSSRAGSPTNVEEDKEKSLSQLLKKNGTEVDHEKKLSTNALNKLAASRTIIKSQNITAASLEISNKLNSLNTTQKLWIESFKNKAKIIGGMNKLFSKIDADHNGSINFVEFCKGLKGYDESEDLDAAVELFAIFDSDGDKNIDLGEFITTLNDNTRIINELNDALNTITPPFEYKEVFELKDLFEKKHNKRTSDIQQSKAYLETAVSTNEILKDNLKMVNTIRKLVNTKNEEIPALLEYFSIGSTYLKYLQRIDSISFEDKLFWDYLKAKQIELEKAIN